MADDIDPVQQYLKSKQAPATDPVQAYLAKKAAKSGPADTSDHPAKAKVEAVNKGVKDASDTFHALRQSGLPGKALEAARTVVGGAGQKGTLANAAVNFVVDSILGAGGAAVGLGRAALGGLMGETQQEAADEVTGGQQAVAALNPLPKSPLVDKSFGAVDKFNKGAGELVNRPDVYGEKGAAAAAASTEAILNGIEMYLMGKAGQVVGDVGAAAGIRPGEVGPLLPEMGEKASVPAFQAKIDAFHDKMVAANAALQQAKAVEKPPQDQPVAPGPSAQTGKQAQKGAVPLEPLPGGGFDRPENQPLRQSVPVAKVAGAGTLHANPFEPIAKALGTFITSTGRELLEVLNTVKFDFQNTSIPGSADFARGIQERAWAAQSEMRTHELWLANVMTKYWDLGEKMGLTNDQLETVHHYGEDARDPQNALNPNQRLLFDEVVRPMSEMNKALRVERGKFDPVSEGEVQYMPRAAKGKGTRIGKRIEGLQEGSLTGIRTTAESDARRKYHDLEAVDGSERVVAKIGSDRKTGQQRVTTFRNKVGEDIGPKDTTTLKELKAAVREAQRKIDGMRAQIARGEGPKHLLERTLQGYKDNFASIKGSLAQAERAALDPEERVLIDKNGRLWRQKETTTRRIKQHTTTDYYMYPVENVAQAIANNASALVYGKLLEAIKNDPQVAQMGLLVKSGSEFMNHNLRPINSPWFQGWHADPMIADIIEDITGRPEPVGDLFRAVTNFLVRPIFLWPLNFIHKGNIASHWAAQRGLSANLKSLAGLPFNARKFATTYRQVQNDIASFSPEYRQYLRLGAGFMHNTVMTREFVKSFTDRLQKMGKDNPLWHKYVYEQGGMANPVNAWKTFSSFSNHDMWLFDDTMKMLAIRERMAKGATVHEAIEAVNKHIPNYKVASRIFYASGRWPGAIDRTLDRFLAQAFRGGGTVFGPYHYGVLKSYSHVTKDLITATKAKDPKNVAHNADILAAIGFASVVTYPFLNWLAQQTTGNKEARLYPLGVTRLPVTALRYAKAKTETPTERLTKSDVVGPFPDESWRQPVKASQIVQQTFTMAPGQMQLLELWMNRDFFTGQEKYTDAPSLITSVVSAYPPVGGVLALKSGRSTPKQTLARVISLDLKTEEQILKQKKYYLRELQKEARDEAKKGE